MKTKGTKTEGPAGVGSSDLVRRLWTELKSEPRWWTVIFIAVVFVSVMAKVLIWPGTGSSGKEGRNQTPTHSGSSNAAAPGHPTR